MLHSPGGANLRAVVLGVPEREEFSAVATCVSTLTTAAQDLDFLLLPVFASLGYQVGNAMTSTELTDEAEGHPGQGLCRF